jgi:AcrR family transcriptional regulator
MARPRTIDNETILDAARQVFLVRGFSATTAEIARKAGIAEGSIFRRYPTKNHLFLAAMGVDENGAKLFAAMIQIDGEPKAALTRFAENAISFFKIMIPRFQMIMCSQKTRHEIVPDGNAPPVQLLKGLSQFIEEAEFARFTEPGHSAVLARIVVGSCFHFAFAEVSGLNRFLPLEKDDFIRGLVDTVTAQIYDPAERIL